MSAAARTLGGTISLTKANVSQLLQYRLVLLLYGLRQVLNPLLYMAVWWAVAGDGDVAGFGRGDVVIYYIVFMGVAHFTWATGFGQLANLIRLGRLSPHLMRPMNPIWVAVSGDLAAKLSAAVMLVPIWIAMYLILRPQFDFQWLNVALFVPSVVLAASLSFVAGACLGLTAFWVTKPWPFFNIWYNVAFAVGGQVAPVALLPGAIKAFAVVLPFRYTLGFPIEVFIGSLDSGELALGFALQAGWTAFGLILMRVLWRSGVKQYQAVGA